MSMLRPDTIGLLPMGGIGFNVLYAPGGPLEPTFLLRQLVTVLGPGAELSVP
jgi:hypothetical protein